MTKKLKYLRPTILGGMYFYMIQSRCIKWSRSTSQPATGTGKQQFTVQHKHEVTQNPGICPVLCTLAHLEKAPVRDHLSGRGCGRGCSLDWLLPLSLVLVAAPGRPWHPPTAALHYGSPDAASPRWAWHTHTRWGHGFRKQSSRAGHRGDILS